VWIRVNFLALGAFLASAAIAQVTTSAGRSTEPGYWYASVGLGSHFLGSVSSVTGAPYSAEEITESVQTLADGTHITHTSTTKVYRDSEGRTRTERPIGAPGSEGADTPVMIQIADPVAHVLYMMNTSDKVAHKQTIESPGPRPFLKSNAGSASLSASAGPSAAPRKARETPDAERPEIKTEKLGTQTIEGLTVDGTRQTITWPAGSRMGNDRPITSVSENWMSPDLKIMVLSKNNDPRSGEQTTRLVNVSRAEPDLNLFQPPADYTVTEETREVLHH